MEISDFISLAGAALATIISIISIILTYKISKKETELQTQWQNLTHTSNLISQQANALSEKLNAINLTSHYYYEIFDKYLVTEIPKARNSLEFVQNKIVGYEDLIKVTDSMIDDSLYFKYTNPKFYNQINEQVDLLHEVSSKYINCGKLSMDKYTEALGKINDAISDIYSTINDGFTCKNRA